MTTARSATARFWDGVRMRRSYAATEPDAVERAVRLPAAWDQDAAAAVAALASAEGRPDRGADLALAAEAWLTRLAEVGGLDLAARAHDLLLRQAACPAEGAWNRAEQGAERGYVLNMAAAEIELVEVAQTAVAAATALWPGDRPRLLLTGLAGFLAERGLDYDSPAARAAAMDVVARLRAAVPGALLCVVSPGPVDALLGVEVSGIAPAFSPLDASGALSRASLAFLAARNVGPASALAALLAGRNLLAPAARPGLMAMDAALRPLLDALPAAPAPLTTPADAVRIASGTTPQRRDLPARRGGTAQKALVGGQKVFVRTGEYADGSLGEVAIALPQASPAVRALVDCLSQVAGIALQHGAAPADVIDAMAGTRFGAPGSVEGDPAVTRAASPLDYVARHLAHLYAPDMPLPALPDDHDDAAPLLPLRLEAEPPPVRRRGLRLVK